MKSLGWLALSLALLVPVPAPAQPASSAAPKTAGKASAAPETSAAPSDDEPLPPGHPPLEGGDPSGDLPPGHPPAGGGQGAFFRPPADQVAPDKSLPAGTLEITIADADGAPIPHAPVRLVVLENTVSRGEKEYSVDKKADAEGRLRLDDLKVGMGVQYTVETTRGEASFQTQAFGMQDSHGMRALLHAYDAVTDLGSAALVMEATVMVEIKEDTFAISHRIRTLNLGRTAYVAQGVSMRLPEDYQAFNNQDSEGTVRMVERDGSAVLQGTFPPGQAELLYRYQLPLEGADTQKLRIPLPPRVVHTTVLVSAGPDMGLAVRGFPEAKAERWHNGQRVLKTVREPDIRFGLQPLLANLDPSSLELTVSGIPTPGPERWLAVLLALGGIAGGVFYFVGSRTGRIAVSNEQRADLREARDALLEELAQLEKARRKGDVGPRSYERIRAALLEALARIVAQLGENSKARGPYRGKTSAPRERAHAAVVADEPTAAKPNAAAEPNAAVKRKKRRKRKLKSATPAG